MKAFGWSIVGQFPDVPKAIFIAAPHTSNMDGFWMIVTAHAMGLKLSWMGKKTLFTFPLGPILKVLGGVSVDRSKTNDTVTQIASEFSRRDGMYLAIAPSGSRKLKTHWKSGFYHIAAKAGVPLLCGCVDYKNKRAGILGVIETTGDLKADMDTIREMYKGQEGRFPELVTPMILRGEEEEEEAALKIVP